MASVEQRAPPRKRGNTANFQKHRDKKRRRQQLNRSLEMAVGTRRDLQTDSMAQNDSGLYMESAVI